MKGKIKIRLGNENQEPMVVYVSHWNTNFEWWVCEKLNTGETVFSNNDELIEFNYKKFKIMFYEWKVKQQDVIKKRYLEELNKWK